eukprot:TRINITY_DN9815_c0_g1_i1.p1 TRINITY_DN9815_c0_g1~~TRINITY_DN9815_c0_g1_i1.p1  ORF type:complete len:725 (-),score=120.21 TRINITY_DN9815_c0_g1_i1:160-2265(-)
MSPGRSMSCSGSLSIDDLRSELQRFATNTLSRQLDELAVRVRREIGEDVRRCSVTSLSDCCGQDLQRPACTDSPEEICWGRRPVGAQGNGNLGLPGIATPTAATPLKESELSTLPAAERHEWAKRHWRNALVKSEAKKIQDQDDDDSPTPRDDPQGKNSSNGHEASSEDLPPIAKRRHHATGQMGLRMNATCEGLDLEYLDAGHGTIGPTHDTLRSKAQAIVESSPFENIVTFVIIGNVFYIALITNHMAVNELTELPDMCKVLEVLFVLVFLAEIILRLYAVPTISYVQRGEKRKTVIEYWNIFDSAVVGLQLLEMLCGWLHIDIEMFGQITVLRLLRLIRIIRVVRIVKVFRVVRHLRMIVFSVFRSLALFVWSVIALLMVTLMWSVYFTEVSLSHKIAHIGDKHGYDPLDEYFGSLPHSMLSLLQAITGGVDWMEVCVALEELDTVFGLVPFLAYIFFTSIALMNVITGVFLETAMERAREEREIYLVRNARVVFAAADKDRSGMITWPDFQKALDNSDLNDFFEAIDIDITEAKNLFDLLDISGDGKISAEEFLSGCLRVRGPAKSLDLLVLSREVAQLFERHAITAAKLDENSQVIQTCKPLKSLSGRFEDLAGQKECNDSAESSGRQPSITKSQTEPMHVAPSISWQPSSGKVEGSRSNNRLMSVTDKLKKSVTWSKKTSTDQVSMFESRRSADN